jgi:hypothetical protein
VRLGDVASPSGSEAKDVKFAAILSATVKRLMAIRGELQKGTPEGFSEHFWKKSRLLLDEVVGLLLQLGGILAVAGAGFAEDYRTCGAPQMIAEVAAALPPHPQVLVDSFHSFLGLAYHNALRDTRKAAETVAAQLTRLPHHPDVLECGFRTLAVLLSEREETSVQVGIAPFLVQKLNEQLDCASVAASGLSLFSVCAPDSVVRNQLVTSGGVEAIVQVMKHHPFDEQVQQTGVFALGSVAEGHEENRARIVALGGLQLIKVATSQFNKNEELIDHANWASNILTEKKGWFG